MLKQFNPMKPVKGGYKLTFSPVAQTIPAKNVRKIRDSWEEPHIFVQLKRAFHFSNGRTIKAYTCCHGDKTTVPQKECDGTTRERTASIVVNITASIVVTDYNSSMGGVDKTECCDISMKKTEIQRNSGVGCLLPSLKWPLSILLLCTRIFMKIHVSLLDFAICPWGSLLLEAAQQKKGQFNNSCHPR